MRGMTLIEAIAAIVIFAVIITATYLVLIVGNRSWYSTDATSEIRQEVVRALLKMQIELAETRPSRTSISVGSSANSITFSLPQDRDVDGTVLNSIGQLEWSDNIVYSRNAGNEVIRTTTGNTTVLARGISSLLFNRTEDTILQVDINATKTSVTGQVLQDTGEITVKMRN
jgi:prepilin-type N-terminal cleavage/methylation domain-containing protein